MDNNILLHVPTIPFFTLIMRPHASTDVFPLFTVSMTFLRAYRSHDVFSFPFDYYSRLYEQLHESLRTHQRAAALIFLFSLTCYMHLGGWFSAVW